MRTLFIADLHLSEAHPEITETFFSFLDNEQEEVDALYILGDLFAVWIGDDEHTPLMDEVAKRLTDYSQKNHIKIFYLHGNRDFMIGKKYAAQAAMELLEKHSEIDLYGNNVLIMHGDTLCLADKHYQTMRTVLHNPLLQNVFNLLPLFVRKKIGWKIRTTSQSKKVSKHKNIMDVTQSEVIRLMKNHKANILIHGHTHKVAKHRLQLSDQDATRFDVGDWSSHFSFIDAQKNCIELIIRPIDYYRHTHS